MPPTDDGKRKAARETIDILYDISLLLVSGDDSPLLYSIQDFDAMLARWRHAAVHKHKKLLPTTTKNDSASS